MREKCYNRGYAWCPCCRPEPEGPPLEASFVALLMGWFKR